MERERERERERLMDVKMKGRMRVFQGDSEGGVKKGFRGK